jgi:SAM-dependent methyltransferase
MKIMNKASTCCDPGCCVEEVQPELETAEKVKAMVREKYGAIAKTEASCCDGGGCGMPEVTSFSESYAGMAGYHPGADLGLGCGLPTDLARIKAGDTVVDLGSGAGNDVFVARAQAGPTGKVIGVDMTPEMIAKARGNNQKMGFNNVEFRQGEIEKMPVESESANVVISNCVLNLVPDKAKAFAEIYRILKPGGHFSVSDIVLSGPLPEAALEAAILYTGCVSGALQKADYLAKAELAGFTEIQVDKEREIVLPNSVLEGCLTQEQIGELANSGTRILSINLFGKKPV